MRRVCFVVAVVVAWGGWAVPAGAQSALSVDGVVESKSGGFQFPDGSVQMSSAPGPAVGLVDGPHRRFVASTGNDTNPCTLAAPCRSFAAAILVTDAKGEIVVLDSGDYGSMSIDKALTVTAPQGVYAGIAVSSGAGVTVNAAASDVVVLRGLTIHGIGGEDGINFTGDGTLHVENCVISDFNEDTGDGPQGIDAGEGRLFVKDTLVKNASTVRVLGEAYFDHVRLEDNRFYGLFLVEGIATIRNSVAAGNAEGLFGEYCCGGTAQLTIENCLVTHNGTGIHSRGIGSTVRVENSVIVNNTTGLKQETSAVLLSRGDNTVEGNGTNVDGTIGSYSTQ